jgi:hypothetical protein
MWLMLEDAAGAAQHEQGYPHEQPACPNPSVHGALRFFAWPK